jgi:hypothetical protein
MNQIMASTRKVFAGVQLAARVMESAKRIRIAFASACPDADLLRAILLAPKPAPT